MSPWYWWADVAPRKSASLYVRQGRYVQSSPKVKYRGIFINDEWPSFGGWATAKFGGLNAKMHTHLFELLLRLKANYLWPAMWATAFNEDDPDNPRLADMYGIIMGTSHHEPMMRAHKEYTRRRDEVGAWNYATNKARLDSFFTAGLRRNKVYDNLFTEVQRYYDKGFTVPDDVLLLFCDNNWGYLRRTGPEKEQGRKGGLGLYYHIDMNGGPWNDRWVTTTTVPKLREQFNLAYRTGIDDLWIINVGDLKPKEIPIDFIMRYAWNPDLVKPGCEQAYLTEWAAQCFGDDLSADVADIVARYTKYNLWRKAEVQVPGIFSIANHREADRVDSLWLSLEEKAEAVRRQVPGESLDAYYQLVYYPAVASSGVARLYNAVTRNRAFARQGRPQAAAWRSVGKWQGMMQDKHIGYTKWSMPDDNILPRMKTVTPEEGAQMGVVAEGNEYADNYNDALALPVFDSMLDQNYYIDVFNRGTAGFPFEAKASEPWVKLSETKASIDGADSERRILVSIDWSKAKTGCNEATVTLKGGGKTVDVAVKAVKGSAPKAKGKYFGNLSGSEFSIPAYMFSRNLTGEGQSWTFLPGLGRGEGCMGASDVCKQTSDKLTSNQPTLEYQVLLPDTNTVTLCIGILPVQDVQPERGMRLAVQIDGQKPVVLDARQGFKDEFQEYTKENLAMSPNLKPLPEVEKNILLTGYGQERRNEVFDNLRWLTACLPVVGGGLHTLKIMMVDPEVVLERIVVNPDNAHPSYFGAPERQF